MKRPTFPMPHRPRLLPPSIAGTPLEVPGLGRFSVGFPMKGKATSTVWVHFQAEGAAEPVPGFLPFTLRVSSGYGLEWELDRAPFGRKVRLDRNFTPEVIAAARDIAGKLDEISPSVYVSHLGGALREEIRQHDVRADELRRMIVLREWELDGRLSTSMTKDEVRGVLEWLRGQFSEHMALREEPRLARLEAAYGAFCEAYDSRGWTVRSVREAVEVALMAEPAAVHAA